MEQRRTSQRRPAQRSSARRSSRRKNQKAKQRKYKVLAVFCGVMAVMILFAELARDKNAGKPEPEPVEAVQTEVEEKPTEIESYQIKNVKVIPQGDMKAGCETCACTMLLNILGFDVDQYTIADNYLMCEYISWDENGNKYGPDMYSAFAGSAYAGWGVYSPSMAKSMNNYLKDQKSNLKAYSNENIPLETLCRDYVSKNVPVMIWATTDMAEPYVFDTWTVNYVDENAKTKVGDSFSWYMHEHCLVLVGYDSKNYYFADSSAGKISVFEKNLVAERYKFFGCQSIVVK